MYLDDKEYYWSEMSYNIYPVLSQTERLQLEYEERNNNFFEKCYDIDEYTNLIYREE